MPFSAVLFIYLATAGWVITIIILVICACKYDLGLNFLMQNVIIRNNQVHNLEIENTKENSTSSCYNETKEETKNYQSI